MRTWTDVPLSDSEAQIFLLKEGVCYLRGSRLFCEWGREVLNIS